MSAGGETAAKSAAPVVTLSAAPAFPGGPEGGSDRFGAQLAPIGKALGLTRLGAMLTTVPPGKRAFPFHCHHANDEMFVILTGSGVYRFGDAEHPVAAGDVCGAPAGGPETAHQLVNTGSEPLSYVSISSTTDPDVVEYPDSGKFGVISIGEGRDFFSARLRYIGRAESGEDYWEDER